MDEIPRIPYNPYRDLSADLGGEVWAALLIDEVYFMMPGRYDVNLRRSAVRFIENLHLKSRPNRSDALIPYTAMTYFDRFCSAGELPAVVEDFKLDNAQLCMLCCFTIAWKLRTKNIDLPRLLRDMDLQFTEENVLRMEMHICKRLRWRIRALTPFNFVEYFIQILNLPPDSPLPRRPVRQLIVKSQYDVAFTKYRPSVVAASAVLVFSRKIFPDQRVVFENRIAATLIFNRYRNMILECQSKLDPLYRDPPPPEEGPSSSIANVEEVRSHRAGKEPALSDPDSGSDSGPTLAGIRKFRKDSVNPDELMDFELGWIEALDKDDNRAISDVHKLTECFNGLREGCHIV